MKKKKIKIDSSTRFFLWTVGVLVIVLLIILSIRFVYHPENRNSYEYNGFHFTKYSGLWYVRMQNLFSGKIYNIAIHYAPRELEDIPIYGTSDEFADIKWVYITFDPLGEDMAYTALAAGELSLVFSRVSDIRTEAACTQAAEACKDRTTVTCEKTLHPTIYLKEAEEPMITITRYCITIQGKGPDLVRAVDKFLMIWYGVME